MKATPFLKAVADAYASRYSDISDFLFVFPGKRSGTFFLKYLQEASATPRLAPAITTISELVTVLSGRETDNRIDLLFTLYDAYLELRRENGDKLREEDFNSFRNWGDTIVADFSAVDMSAVDAAEIFSNVRDYREIQSSFLSEEQMAVLEEYFGVSYSREHLDRFWSAMTYTSPTDKPKRHTPVRENYSRLWAQLGPLYERFNAMLDKRGLTYPGKAYRLALECLEREDAFPLPYRKIVFVGFNVLTKIEWLIFDNLRRRTTETDGRTEPLADFIWDATGPVLGASEGDDDSANSAVRFIARNRRRFPEPKWMRPFLEPSDTQELPDVLESHASPSDVMQAKIAGGILKDIIREKGENIFTEARVAMVLPDEWLLLPALYSLPEEIRGVNLTMGYPLRLTSVLSMMERIRGMQLRRRRVDGTDAFFHEDIVLLLGHPLAQKLIGARTARSIKSRIINEKLYTLTPAQLTEMAPHTDFLWQSLRDCPAREAIAYLDRILDRTLNALYADFRKETDENGCADSAEQKKALRHGLTMEASHIAVYRDALRRLDDAIAAHGVEMNASALFSLVDRLLAPERVNFEGEPLQGLQIMGLLETRCLDFDCLVIPSMSEKIFPMRMRSKTFIPDNLRRAYGMPPANYEESVFAYYFYRLISRASRVYLLHDARVGGLRSGDVSRYVLQLQHLYAPECLRLVEHTFSLTSPRERELRADKTGEIARRLERFFDPESKVSLSASTLSSYMNCPMKFFFEKVAGFNRQNPPTEFMDAATAGTIVHGAVEALYLPNPDDRKKLLARPRLLDEAFLSGLLANEGVIVAAVDEQVRKEYLKEKEGERNGLPIDAEMSRDMLVRHTKAIIAHDLHLARSGADIALYGTEIKAIVPFPTSSGRPVNMQFAIDRLDAITDTSGKRIMRVVDYKTGYVGAEAAAFEDIFSGDGKAKNIFQPLLYANVYNILRRIETGENDEVPIRCELYNVPAFSRQEHAPTLPAIGGQTILSHTGTLLLPEGELDINREFLRRTDSIITEIFDTAVPFTQTCDPEGCLFCNFRPFCDR